MEHARFALLTQAITFPSNINRRGVMQQPIEHGRRKDIVLECVIMPLCLIVLLVEAILGAVSHLLQLNIPVLRMPLASWYPVSLPTFSQ
jgi:hypothetical protein